MPFADILRNQPDREFTLCPGANINTPCWQGLPVTGHVGIELEVEGNNLPGAGNLMGVVDPQLNRVWLVKPDGSLRGGLEYVLSGPVETASLRHMVNGLFEQFRRPGCTINNSNRCSTHVHVNVSNLKVNEITSVIALWCTLQSAFIRWHGEQRVANHFCLSSRDEESMLEAWLEYLRQGMIPGQGRRDGIKYTALNILPIFTQGSVEFRCGGAPDSEDKIVWWAKICNAIVRYAAENYKNPVEFGYAISEQGPETILRRVLELANLGPITTDKIYAELTEDGNFFYDAMSDFRDIQPLLYSIPWDSLMDEINKENVPNPFAAPKKAKPRMIRLGDFEDGRIPPAPPRPREEF